MTLILTMRFQDKEHQLTRSRGVAVITSPCHGEDRGFDSRRDRLPSEICSGILRYVKAKTLTLDVSSRIRFVRLMV